jgi:mono/diheme cytochrome c family protein
LASGHLSGRIGLAAGLLAVFLCAAVRAEDLDQGKSAQKLFADTCSACHKSARGLTKRGYIPLYLFLRDHYSTSSTAAWSLTSYLESVEDAQRGRTPKAANKAAKRAAPNGTSGATPRPPEAVPKR